MNILKPHLQTTELTLLVSNTSQHEIARVTQINRTAIRAYAKRWREQKADSPGVSTGSADQIPPPRPPARASKQAVSACSEPYRKFILVMRKATEIGPQPLKLCETWFASDGRVGHRQLWGIARLAEHNPKRMAEQACAIVLRDGVNSYKTIKTLVERLVADALAVLDAPRQGEILLTQEHHLIRSGDEYGDLFEMATRQNAERLLNHRQQGNPTP